MKKILPFIYKSFEDCRSPAERRLKAERLQEFESDEERNQLKLLAQVQGMSVKRS